MIKLWKAKYVLTSLSASLHISLVLIFIAPGHGRDRRICLLRKVGISAPTQCVSWTVFAGIKRPGREADHSSPYSVQVKNDGATCLPPLFNASLWSGI
jgi:hypothetical protein